MEFVARADRNRSPLNISGIEDTFLSGKASFSRNGSGTFALLDETGTDDIWYNAMWNAPNSDDTLFALHDACIVISCKSISHYRTRSGKICEAQPALAALYRLLNDRLWERHADRNIKADTVNDLFELCRTSSRYGPRSVLALAELDWWGGQYDVRPPVPSRT